MEHEDAVGEVVGDSGARKIEHVVNGTMEYTYIDGELALFIDRDPKYKLDLGEIRPKMALDNPYIKLFLEEAIQRVNLDELKPCCDKHDKLRPSYGGCGHALFDGCEPCCWNCPEWKREAEEDDE